MPPFSIRPALVSPATAADLYNSHAYADRAKPGGKRWGRGAVRPRPTGPWHISDYCSGEDFPSCAADIPGYCQNKQSEVKSSRSLGWELVLRSEYFAE